MPRPTIAGRATSINAAFVHAIIPRQVDLAHQQSLFAEVGINPMECVFCGRPRTDTDHLRPIVRGGRPSGYFHVTNNLVPACGPCNQSKTGNDWRVWIRSTTARGSPTYRGVADVDDRVARLELFETIGGLMEPVPETDLRNAVGPDAWDEYWALRDRIVGLMVEAQTLAENIEPVISDWYQAHNPAN